jgi:CAAX protease family protein
MTRNLNNDSLLKDIYINNGNLNMSTNSTYTIRSETSSVKSWITHHPITAYFLIAFGGTWLLDSPMVFGKDGLGILPFSVPFPIYAALFILGSYAGPTLAALLITNTLEGGAGVKAFLRRYFQWRVAPLWYLVAFFGYPLIYILADVIWLGIAPLRNIFIQWPAFFTMYLPSILIFPGLITWGEEPGWRGFAQMRLQEQLGALKASLVIGFLHGLWHLPIFFIVSGPVANGPFTFGQFVQNILTIMLITVIWTWIFNNAKQSILIAVLIHASGNAVQQLIAQWIPDFSQSAQYTVLGFYVVIALVLVLSTKGRLAYKPANQ